MPQEERLIVLIMQNVAVVFRPLCIDGFFCTHALDLLNAADDRIEEAAALHFHFHGFAVNHGIADRRNDRRNDLQKNEDDCRQEQLRRKPFHLGKIDAREREVQQDIQEDIDNHRGEIRAVGNPL